MIKFTIGYDSKITVLRYKIKRSRIWIEYLDGELIFTYFLKVRNVEKIVDGPNWLVEECESRD